MKNTLPRVLGVKNNSSKLSAIYANPEHIRMLISRTPTLSEVELAIPNTRAGVYWIKLESSKYSQTVKLIKK